MTTARRLGERWGIVLAFFLAHAVILLAIFRTVYTLAPSSGTGVFYNAATKLLAGRIPYRDNAAEYPPFALFFFALPRFAGERFSVYYDAFNIEVLLADLAVIVTLFFFARRAGKPPWVTLTAYTIFVLAVGPLIIEQFDLFPAAITLAAVYAYSRGRYPTSGALLAIGAMTKLYPLLLAPLFALVLWRRGERAAITRSVMAFVGTTLIVLAPLLAAAPSALRLFAGSQAARGIQIESTYASIVLVADKVGLAHAGIAMASAAWNVTGPLADIFTPASAVVFVLAVGWATSVACRSFAHAAALDIDVLSTGTLLVLTCALLASKVLSPQYLIWLMPFIPLAPAPLRRSLWPIFVLIGILTYYIFPTSYTRLLYQDDGFIILMLVIRNALLGVVAWLLARQLRRVRPLASELGA